MKYFSHTYIKELSNILNLFPHKQFELLVEVMLDAYNKDKTIFVMGNGGSTSTASHWASDINKGCCFEQEKKFKMICLNDSLPTILAYANDLSYDDVFVEQLKNFFRSGDLIIGISASANSTNVLKAIEYANKNGSTTVGLCGFSGGELKEIAHIPLHVDVNDMQKVEDVHLIIAHMTMQWLTR